MTLRLHFRPKVLAFTAIALSIVVVAVLANGWRTREARRAEHPTFIGSVRCAQCHNTEYAAWKTSQHSLAMQNAGPGAVLGRFDSTRFTDAGITTTFFRRDDRYVVNTEGADGRLHDFDVRYTFGVFPLQQYLVELSGGHVQALLTAWDSRPAAEGAGW